MVGRCEVCVLGRQLAEVFSAALGLELPSEKPTVVTVAHSGNWKAIYPTVRDSFPALSLAAGTQFPVVFGGDAAFYLQRMGPAGAVEFKHGVRQLLAQHDRIFVFETQKIECLQSNPGCISDVMMPGRSATLFFRDAIPSTIAKYLNGLKASLDWHPETICPSSVSVLATKLVAGILCEEFVRVAALITAPEREVLDTMKDPVFNSVAPELEDLFFESSFGAGKLREMARRKLAIALLRVTTPPYSLKSGRDPVQFFRDELAHKFLRHGLPIGAVSEVAPNLSFVVKSQKRFSELHFD
jgi:hypothetical protein